MQLSGLQPCESPVPVHVVLAGQVYALGQAFAWQRPSLPQVESAPQLVDVHIMTHVGPGRGSVMNPQHDGCGTHIEPVGQSLVC